MNPPHPMLECLKVAFSISRLLFSEEFWLDDSKGPISAVVVEGIQLGCWVKIMVSYTQIVCHPTIALLFVPQLPHPQSR